VVVIGAAVGVADQLEALAAPRRRETAM